MTDPEQDEGIAGLPLWLFALAAAARMAAALQTRVITPDGVEYVWIARLFSEGETARALAHPHHPLYPFLVSAARGLSTGWTAAAGSVSILFGALAVLPLYALLRGGLSRRAAVFACVVYAFLPPFVRFGADAISETTFHFFFLASLALAFSAFRKGPAWRSALGGLAGAMAYLTRPEGIGIALSVAVWAVARAGFSARERARTLGLSALFLGAFAAGMLPYLLHIRAETGTFALTMKKPVSHFLNAYRGEYTDGAEGGPDTDLPTSSSWPGAAWRAGDALARTLFFFPLVLAFLGLVIRPAPRDLPGTVPSRGSGPPDGFRARWFASRDPAFEGFVLVPAVLWMGLCVLLARSHGYVSHRHASPAGLMLLPLAALGAAALARWAGALARPFGREERARLEAGLLAGLAVLLSVVGSTTAFRAYRSGKVFLVDIGSELRLRPEAERSVIMGNRVRISYYAGARHRDLPPFADLRETSSQILASGAGLVVLDFLDPHFALRHAALAERFADPARPPVGFRLVRRWRIGEASGRQRDIAAYVVDRAELAKWVVRRAE